MGIFSLESQERRVKLGERVLKLVQGFEGLGKENKKRKYKKFSVPRSTRTIKDILVR